MQRLEVQLKLLTSKAFSRWIIVHWLQHREMRLSILNPEPESICRMPSTSETLELKPTAPGRIHSVLPRATISLILTVSSEKSKMNLLFTGMKEQLLKNVRHLIISLLTLQGAMQSGLAPFLSWLQFLLLVSWQRKDWSRSRPLQSSADVGLREAWVSLLQSWIQKTSGKRFLQNSGATWWLFLLWVAVWFLQSGLQFMSKVVSHRRIAIFGGYFVYAFALKILICCPLPLSLFVFARIYSYKQCDTK